MKRSAVRARILSPLERFSEIVFGLIMVLSFTGALSVVEAGREDVRTMLLGAIGCNLAWGIIDAAFYLFACLTEHGRNVAMLRKVQQCVEPARAQQLIAGSLPPKVAEALRPADFERIHEHLKKEPRPIERLKLTGENWRGALGVFLLVFATTFPVVIPFIFIRDARFALRLSNVIAILLLFGAGRMLATYAGLRRPILAGLVMVAIGTVLVALTIAFGG